MKKHKIIIVILAIILCVSLIIGGISLYGKYQMNKIPELTYMEALAYTTKDKPEAVVTIGIIKDGQLSYTVYGENAEEVVSELHTYEIGSITKTFTAALINKAIDDGLVSLDQTIDHYLELPKGKEYPTIKALLTHTSGYQSFYFEKPMISNFLNGRNDYYGITKEMVLAKVRQLSVDKANDDFKYSNFGFAVLGLVLEAVYETDYMTLANGFIQNDLGLDNTRVLAQDGDLGNYWEWTETDAYLSAGDIRTNISDMLLYAKMQVDRSPYFSECHNSLKIIHDSTEKYRIMDINIDEMGMAWSIDRKNDIIWHNGATGNYNAYIGFSPKTGNAVVVLSNLLPSYRIPATVIGIKLLNALNANN
jgi:CubicO group peptidase (beta-lactamase class C family)